VEIRLATLVTMCDDPERRPERPSGPAEPPDDDDRHPGSASRKLTPAQRLAKLRPAWGES